MTKTRDITGLPAFDGSGEAAYSPDGKQAYGIDPNGVDTESLALDRRDGSLWLGEEYGPSILHVAADGTILMRLVPGGRTIDAPGGTSARSCRLSSASVSRTVASRASHLARWNPPLRDRAEPADES